MTLAEFCQSLADQNLPSAKQAVGILLWHRNLDPNSELSVEDLRQTLRDHDLGNPQGSKLRDAIKKLKVTLPGKLGGLRLRADSVGKVAGWVKFQPNPPRASKVAESPMPTEPAKPARKQRTPGKMVVVGRPSKIRVFVSHAALDVKITKALVDFIEAAINVPKAAIRCTSVHGYKLEGGDDGPDVLRADLANADLVFGVVTKNALDSFFVLMELGAGWGLQKRVIPLMGPGADFKDMKGPYYNIHGLKLDSLEDMMSLPATIAKATGLARSGNDSKTTAALTALIAITKEGRAALASLQTPARAGPNRSRTRPA